MKQSNVTSLSYLKELSTNELDELLQKELHKEHADSALVRLILSVLEEREGDYPLELNAELIAAAEQFERALGTQKTEPSKKRFSWLIKAASILLVMGILFFAVPQDANAENIFEMLARWTDSIFEFFYIGENGDKQPEYVFETDHPGLQEIYNKAVELGITDPVVPTWVPEGYILEELLVFEEPSELSLHANMKYRGREIRISFGMQSVASPLNHMKDTKNIVVYEAAGVEHYIMSNYEQTSATWIVGNMECSVVADCQEDIYRILKSIYTAEDY